MMSRMIPKLRMCMLSRNNLVRSYPSTFFQCDLSASSAMPPSPNRRQAALSFKSPYESPRVR